MNRIIPLLLCLVIGSSVDGGLWATPRPKVKAERPVSTHIETDPTPPVDPLPVSPVVPVLSLPEKIITEVGVPFFVKATTNCVKVIWLEQDPASRLWIAPSGIFKDDFLTMGIGLTPGDYKLKAIAAMNSDPVQSDWCVITVIGPQPPPGPPNPPDPPPQPPVPVLTQNLLIYTFDTGVARSPKVAKVLNDPYWIALNKTGHKFHQWNNTNKAAMDAFKPQILANDGLPCIVIMDLTNNKWLNKSPDDLKFPADVATLKNLIAKYTGNLP